MLVPRYFSDLLHRKRIHHHRHRNRRNVHDPLWFSVMQVPHAFAFVVRRRHRRHCLRKRPPRPWLRHHERWGGLVVMIPWHYGFVSVPWSAVLLSVGVRSSVVGRESGGGCEEGP